MLPFIIFTQGILKYSKTNAIMLYMKIKISKIFSEYQLESSFIFWLSAINLTCFAFEYFTVSSDMSVFAAVVASAIIVFTAIVIVTYLRVLFSKSRRSY